ncbi:unnamed protein product [Laminaria digitata]
MTSRQSTTTATPRAGATAARKSSATPTSIPPAAVSKHNTRRVSRDARGEKRSEATAAAAAAATAAAAPAHGAAVATAAVGAKPQSPMVVRSSSRGRPGSRSGDLGPSSRQPNTLREGTSSSPSSSPASSAAATAYEYYAPQVGPRQGASLPLGTAWPPSAGPAPAGWACGATSNGGNNSRAGRVQHPHEAMAQQDQDNGGTAKAGAARHAGQGGGRVVRRAHGKSAPSPRARAQSETAQGGKRKRKGTPTTRGAGGIPTAAEGAGNASTAAAAVAAVPAPSASPAAQLAAAKPPHAAATGFPLQLKKAGPGVNEAAVERFDRFPRMLQDKEKCALLRAIERCPEPENVASFLTKGKAKYEFWRANILTAVVTDLEGDKEYRGNARELFGSIQYFTAIYNWVRNQKKQLEDFYSNPNRSGKDDFDFSGQTALMEARRRAFKDRIPTAVGGKKEASGKGKKAPGKSKEASGKGKEASGKRREASGKGNESSETGKETSPKGKGKGKRKAVASTTATSAAAAPASSPPQTPQLSGNPTGGDESLVRKGKSRRKGSKDWRVPVSGAASEDAGAPSLVNGTHGHGSGSGNADGGGGGGGGESTGDIASLFSEDAYEKAKRATLASALSAPGMCDQIPPDAANGNGPPGEKERNVSSSKKRNQRGGGAKAARQGGADGSTTFEKRIAEDLAKLAEAVKGGGGGGASSTPAVPAPNALDIAAQRLKTAQFLWQLKKEGCQSVEVEDKTIWELALKSADI